MFNRGFHKQGTKRLFVDGKIFTITISTKLRMSKQSRFEERGQGIKKIKRSIVATDGTTEALRAKVSFIPGERYHLLSDVLRDIVSNSLLVVNFTTCREAEMPVGDVKNFASVLIDSGRFEFTIVILKQRVKVNSAGLVEFWDNKVLKMFRVSSFSVSNPCIHVFLTERDGF